MPVIATLELTLTPDAVDKAPAVIHDTLVATRAFDGCLGVQVLFDTSDPSHVILLETWESASHDAAYRAWRATGEGASGLGGLLAAPPVHALWAEQGDV